MSIDIATLRPKLEAALGAQLQLGALLGQGGFAAVFRAYDPFLDRDVAIKVLDPSLAVDAAREEQFLHEARTIAAAEHPHIVPLYSAGSTGGLPYPGRRLLPGQSLKDRIAEGKAPAAEAARVGLECARALAAAHAVGVVHRDIKPGNILLDANGNATVTDFGIALVTSRPAGELLGSTTGTPLYMSPEQSLGEQVDGRSDVYALGVVLYEMLTGTCPFSGRNATEVIAKHISAPIPKVSEREPQMPVVLVRLVDRMLSKEPAGRPTAAELVKELTAASTPDGLLTPFIRRTPHGTIRRSLEESDINLQPMKRGGSAGGLLIVKRKGAAPDTLYQDLSGREAFLLMNEFVTLQRAQKARDSTSK